MSLVATRTELWNLLVEQGYPLYTEENWNGLKDHALRWFADLKVDESDTKFNDAVRESRMTIRAVKEDRQTGMYGEKAFMIRGGDRGDVAISYRTAQGVQGMKERMVHTNYSWTTAQTKQRIKTGQLAETDLPQHPEYAQAHRPISPYEYREKYVKGLHDLSASLIDPSRTIQLGEGVGGAKHQVYRLTGDTLYVFMPVAREEDSLMCWLLIQLSKRTTSDGLRHFVNYMKSRLTRIKFIFDNDAGINFKDTAPRGELLPKIRYHYGKLLSSKSTKEEIAKRKLEATNFTTCFRGNNRTEVVVAYRQNGTLSQPSSFPIFAKGVFERKDQEKLSEKGKFKGFAVVGEDMQPKQQIVLVSAMLSGGNAGDLGGEMTYPGCG